MPMTSNEDIFYVNERIKIFPEWFQSPNFFPIDVKVNGVTVVEFVWFLFNNNNTHFFPIVIKLTGVTVVEFVSLT